MGGGTGRSSGKVHKGYLFFDVLKLSFLVTLSMSVLIDVENVLFPVTWGSQ